MTWVQQQQVLTIFSKLHCLCYRFFSELPYIYYRKFFGNTLYIDGDVMTLIEREREVYFNNRMLWERYWNTMSATEKEIEWPVFSILLTFDSLQRFVIHFNYKHATLNHLTTSSNFMFIFMNLTDVKTCSNARVWTRSLNCLVSVTRTPKEVQKEKNFTHILIISYFSSRSVLMY